MDTPYIPAATAAKLAEEHPKGTRHKAAMDIAFSLVGNGLSANAVFAQLRDKFPADVTDEELTNVVRWAEDKRPTPSGYGTPQARNADAPARRFYPARVSEPKETPKRSPAQHAAWWLTDATMTPDAFASKSQLPIPECPKAALTFLLEMLYLGKDNLNVVCKYILDGEKARPCGGGKVLTRDKWIEYLAEHDFPESKAGAWFRPNPCNEIGSGADKAITDSDISSCRFLLIESDVLPIAMQFALFDRLRLPFAAVLSSGGQSIHGWLRMESKSEKEFSDKARKILSLLAPFGIDQANKNPSRLSRLPGAVRVIGGVAGGAQRLYQLNPAKPAITDADIEALENALLIPAVEEKPFQKLIQDSIGRYEDLVNNRGKLGVPTGIETFDRVSGGLKAGGYTLIAAQTGVGKSTIALNIFNHALKSGVGVVLFSLEMSRDDIADMMFSINCNVDRNHFNTGEFTEDEIKSMTVAACWMKELPLWIDDDPSATVEKIRRRVLQLKSENRIGLAVIDYAQLATPDVTSDSREQAVAAVALGLRMLGREANIPIVVLSQLNDDNRVRESRKLAHEAANLFILERDSENLSDPNMTLRIAKGRKIPTTPIRLHFKAEFCRITERSGVDADDVPKPSAKKYRPTTYDP